MYTLKCGEGVAAYKGINYIEIQNIHNTTVICSISMKTMIINVQLATIDMSVLNHYVEKDRQH